MRGEKSQRSQRSDTPSVTRGVTMKTKKRDPNFESRRHEPPFWLLAYLVYLVNQRHQKEIS